MLSSITERFDIPTNKLYALKDRLLARGTPLIDLISGNVSTSGIYFPSRVLSQALSAGLKKTKTYKPDPLGQEPARTALSRYYASEGMKIPSSQFVLTPGTSVSYLYAFKALADAGDEILCPTPSYPLFDSIAALCGVTLKPYRLEEKNGWKINLDHLESSVNPRTKAIVLISPHNPTGAVATAEEVSRMASLAAQKNLAIISDEVFSPFLFGLKSLPRPAAASAPLVLTLNGFSKMLALPGLKIGWMAVTGDPSLVKKTLRALEMISDTFLPVNETAQFAVPDLLGHSRAFQTRYVAKIQQNIEFVSDLLKEQSEVSFVKPKGGFFLTMKVNGDEEELALRLLKEHRVLVHPGYFYDMEGQHLVMSYVHKPAMLHKALLGLANVYKV